MNLQYQIRAPWNFIRQFDVLLLDMGDTFMFGVDRFGEDDGLYNTYRDFGGKDLGDQEVNQILLEVFNELVADGKNSEKFECIDPVSVYLKRHPIGIALNVEEIDLLEAVFAEHEIGYVPRKYIHLS